MEISKNVAEKIVAIFEEYEREDILIALGLQERSPKELSDLKTIESATKQNDLWPIINGSSRDDIKEMATEKLIHLLYGEFKILESQGMPFAKRFDLYNDIASKITRGKRQFKIDFETEIRTRMETMLLVELNAANTAEKCAHIRHLAFAMNSEKIRIEALAKGLIISKTVEDLKITGSGRGVRPRSREFLMCVGKMAELLQKKEDEKVPT